MQVRVPGTLGATFSATPRNVLRAPRRRVTSDTYRRQDVKCKHVFEGIEVREGSHGHRHGSLIELEVRFDFGGILPVQRIFIHSHRLCSYI